MGNGESKLLYRECRMLQAIDHATFREVDPKKWRDVGNSSFQHFTDGTAIKCEACGSRKNRSLRWYIGMTQELWDMLERFADVEAVGGNVQVATLLHVAKHQGRLEEIEPAILMVMRDYNKRQQAANRKQKYDAIKSKIDDFRSGKIDEADYIS